MFPRAILLIALALLASSPALHAQRQTSQWRFGFAAGIVFPESGPPVSIPFAWNDDATSGSTSIADPEFGRLLFYAKGTQIFDRHGSRMANSDTIRGCAFRYGCDVPPQGLLALRRPGSQREYAIFHSASGRRTVNDNHDFSDYAATLIDLTANDGNGAVTQRELDIWPSASAMLTGVRMCNRDGYWLIGHEVEGSRFVVWSYDSSGITTPRTQDVAGSFRFDTTDMWTGGHYWTGLIKATVDGRRLAVYTARMNEHLELHDFDPARGQLGDSVAVRIWVSPRDERNALWSVRGLSFSPSGRYLYVAEAGGARLFRFDVSTNDSLAIARSRTVVATSSQGFGMVQLGLNGRLYVSELLRDALGAVIDPDEPGIPRFESDAVILAAGSVVQGALPNFVEGDLGFRYVTSPARTVCAGDSVRLGGRWIANPRWSPSAGLSCTDCLDPVARPSRTTTYFLHNSASPGCGPMDSVVVTVNPLPEATVSGDTVVCPREITTLTVQTTGTVRWHLSDDLSCTDCRTVTVDARTSTTYVFEVTSDQGCTMLDSVRVTVAPLPAASAGADTTICLGGAVQLRATGGGTYRWSPAEGLSCTDCAEPIASPAVTTRYRVTVTSDAGCVAGDDMTVTVAPPSTVDAGSDARVCPGASVRLGASGGTSYRWDASDDLSCLECADPLATPARTTTYHVTATSASGCVARDSVTVVVDEPPRLSIEGDAQLCAGGSARLRVTGAERYRWTSSVGELPCTDCAELLVTPQMTTTYIVEGTSAAGCVARDSFTVAVVEQPTVTITGGGEVCAGMSTTLVAGGATSYQWSPSEGLSCTDCAEPEARPTSTTTYRVVGTIAGGCADTAEVTVVVDEPRHIGASIERGVRILPGRQGTLHITTDEALTTRDATFELRWNPRVLLLDDVRLTDELARSGWTLATVAPSDGHRTMALSRPTPGALPAGPLLRLTMTAFVGDSMATELPLLMRASAGCATFATRDGQVVIDSICGLSLRLIEASDLLLRLAAPRPNPATEIATVTFTLPFDERVRLELVDARGVTRTLVDGDLPTGEHTVTLDARALDAGLYDVRLRAGGRLRQALLVVVR